MSEPGQDSDITARGRAWAPQLAALVDAALPSEELSADELLAVCWDDPDPRQRPDDVGLVLASGDDLGAAVAVVRSYGEAPDAHRVAYVKLLVVHPDARRQGRGHRLLEAIEQWAWAQGAAEVQLAGSAPFYLWPGVDATATEMLCIAESRGYRPFTSDVNMALSTAFRAEPPEGTTVRRVIAESDVALVHDLIDAHWPEWWPETERAIEHGCCHAVFVTDPDAPGGARAIGFGCHSVNRAGWLGPMGTDPAWRSGGVGRALLGQICRDLMIAEFEHTEISWVGPVRFYAKSGATVSRVFRGYRLRRPVGSDGGA